MYSYTLKVTYDQITRQDREFIQNIPKDITWNWTMVKIRYKITQLKFKKWFKHLTRNFSKEFPEAFRPNPFLVTLGGSVIIIGLMLQLQ